LVYIIYNLLQVQLKIEKELVVVKVQEQVKQLDVVTKVKNLDLGTVKKEVSKVVKCHFTKDYLKLVLLPQ